MGSDEASGEVLTAAPARGTRRKASKTAPAIQEAAGAPSSFQPRVIRFSEFKDLGGAGVSWLGAALVKRKRVLDDGEFKLLKIDGERALIQFAVNRVKKFFRLRPMKMELVLDEETGRHGSLIRWENHFSSFTNVSSRMMDQKGCRELAKIMLFDVAIGNNDRTAINILYLKDFTIFPIDEGESFRFYSNPKIRLKQSCRQRLIGAVQKDRKWLSEFVAAVSKEAAPIKNSLMRDGIPVQVAEEVFRRVKNLQTLAKDLFA